MDSISWRERAPAMDGKSAISEGALYVDADQPPSACSGSDVSERMTLRATAEQALGADFDVREFYDRG